MRANNEIQNQFIIKYSMKKLLTSFCLSSLIVCVSAQTKVEFENMLSQINADSLKKTVQDLQNFGDRYCDRTPEGNIKVAQYLVDRLKNYGIDNAKIDSFHVSMKHWLVGDIDRYFYNVVGRLLGESESDSTIIIGAHLDAIALVKEDGKYTLLATSPGADDNASGCAIMIEMARIFYENNLKPTYNIDFMAYDAEELGLIGAYYDAEKRKNANEKIIMMMNNDMVLNQPYSETWTLNFEYYDNSLDITEKAMQLCKEYTILTPHTLVDSVNAKSRQASDSWAYSRNGFRATYSAEHTLSDYYHTVADFLEYYNPEYIKEVGKMNFALLYNYAVANTELFISTRKNDAYSVIVFPNPTTDIVRIHHYNNTQIDKIEIYDIIGRLLDSHYSVSNQTVIDLKNFNSGVYIIKIYTSYGVVNKKIIKR